MLSTFALNGPVATLPARFLISTRHNAIRMIAQKAADEEVLVSGTQSGGTETRPRQATKRPLGGEMKRGMFGTIVSLSLFVAVVVSSVVAQGRPQVRADIPFSFHAGNTVLPSGKYTINRPASTNGMILVRSEKGGKAAYVISNNKESANSPENSRLVFRRYGDQYFLAQLWTKGDTAGVSFPVSKEEKKMINSRSDRHLAMADVEEVVVNID